MSASARALLALGLLGAGCDSTTDPCEGKATICLGVHLHTTVNQVDQIRVAFGGRTLLTPMPAADPLPFPVRFAIELPEGTTSAHFDFDGLITRSRAATAATDVDFTRSRHVQRDLTLLGLGGGDGGADFAPTDLATPPPSTDLAGAVTLTILPIQLSGATSVFTVTASPPAPSCGTNCYVYPQGQTVDLTVIPMANRFLGWGGLARCGIQTSCTVTLSRDAGVTASFSGRWLNRAFVTSTAHGISELAALNPLTNADAICQGHATALSPPGTFQAWLSLGSKSATSRFSIYRGWVRMDGLPFADHATDLALGTLYPLTFDELGNPSTQRVWTGSSPSGAVGANCSDWTISTNVSTATYGIPSEGTGAWQSLGTQGCDQMAALYCLETSNNMPLTITPTSGARQAFVTNMPWVPSGSLTTADSFCASQAGTGALSGTFKAYLNTQAGFTNGGGLTRFSLSLGPWERLDHVLLAPTAALTVLEGSNPERLAPLDQGPDGSYRPYGETAWIGNSATNCANWSDMGAMGMVISVTRVGASFGSVLCNTSRQLFCLQE